MTNLTKLVSRLTPRLKQSLENAVGEALKCRSRTVEIVHWLPHVLLSNDTELNEFLQSQGVDFNLLQNQIELSMERGSLQANAQPMLSSSLSKTIEQAWLIASLELDQHAILPEVLVLALIDPNSFIAETKILEVFKKVSTEALKGFAQSRLGVSMKSAVEGHAGLDSSAVTRDALSKFTIDLTEMAKNGDLDAVLGRTAEVSQCIDVLLRKRQNNPILLGSPGVGKTAIAEGLAQQIVTGNVPDQLQGAQLLSLDMGMLQAGASIKGEFEERLKNVISEVANSSTPIIMFIDEAHTMIGAGGTEGQNDAANLLKPALARGEFRTIAATTFAEYKKYFEKDPALSRRFQPITVDEPNAEVSVNILRAVSQGLTDHHGVFITESAIRAAVELSIRFLPVRKLPDKAISIIDTACARVSLSQHSCPKEIELLREQLSFAEVELQRCQSDKQIFGDQSHDLDMLKQRKNLLSDNLKLQENIWQEQQNLADKKLQKARLSVDGDEQDYDQPLVELTDGLNKKEQALYVHPWVTEHTVAGVVSDWSGVPINNLAADEGHRLIALETVLASRVMGQSGAISAITKALKISRAGLTDIRKPIGVFLMCGPSGVGKTETALAIADQFFGAEDAIVSINMTEFKEAHKTSMLLGAPAGYVGYGKGGVLTEAIKQRPYCVLLLDEMEKAHPAIHDVFFQIFDKGYINDSEGQRIDFRNTIIIMTSNAGGEKIHELAQQSDSRLADDDLVSYLRPVLLEYFSPAFIGRTELIAYLPLDKASSSTLVDIHLGRIKERLQAQYGVLLVWQTDLLDYIVNANLDPLSGGRALESIVNRQLLPLLAQACIERLVEGVEMSQIDLAYTTNGITVEVT